jgi:carboxypeptidase Taq
MTAYASAVQSFARIATLHEASAMLGWDAAAMMPPGGAAARGEQMATLAGLAHELLTAPVLAETLAAAEPPDDAWAATNLAQMRDAQRRATALPRDLVHRAPRVGLPRRPRRFGGGGEPDPPIR